MKLVSLLILWINFGVETSPLIYEEESTLNEVSKRLVPIYSNDTNTQMFNPKNEDLISEGASGVFNVKYVTKIDRNSKKPLVSSETELSPENGTLSSAPSPFLASKGQQLLERFDRNGLESSSENEIITDYEFMRTSSERSDFSSYSTTTEPDTFLDEKKLFVEKVLKAAQENKKIDYGPFHPTELPNRSNDSNDISQFLNTTDFLFKLLYKNVSSKDMVPKYLDYLDDELEKLDVFDPDDLTPIEVTFEPEADSNESTSLEYKNTESEEKEINNPIKNYSTTERPPRNTSLDGVNNVHNNGTNNTTKENKEYIQTKLPPIYLYFQGCLIFGFVLCLVLSVVTDVNCFFYPDNTRPRLTAGNNVQGTSRGIEEMVDLSNVDAAAPNSRNTFNFPASFDEDELTIGNTVVRSTSL